MTSGSTTPGSPLEYWNSPGNTGILLEFKVIPPGKNYDMNAADLY